MEKGKLEKEKEAGIKEGKSTGRMGDASGGQGSLCHHGPGPPWGPSASSLWRVLT